MPVMTPRSIEGMAGSLNRMQATITAMGIRQMGETTNSLLRPSRMGVMLDEMALPASVANEWPSTK